MVPVKLLGVNCLPTHTGTLHKVDEGQSHVTRIGFTQDLTCRVVTSAYLLEHIKHVARREYDLDLLPGSFWV